MRDVSRFTSRSDNSGDMFINCLNRLRVGMYVGVCWGPLQDYIQCIISKIIVSKISSTQQTHVNEQILLINNIINKTKNRQKLICVHIFLFHQYRSNWSSGVGSSTLYEARWCNVISSWFRQQQVQTTRWLVEEKGMEGLTGQNSCVLVHEPPIPLLELNAILPSPFRHPPTLAAVHQPLRLADAPHESSIALLEPAA